MSGILQYISESGALFIIVVEKVALYCLTLFLIGCFPVGDDHRPNVTGDRKIMPGKR